MSEGEESNVLFGVYCQFVLSFVMRFQTQTVEWFCNFDLEPFCSSTSEAILTLDLLTGYVTCEALTAYITHKRIMGQRST